MVDFTYNEGKTSDAPLAKVRMLLLLKHNVTAKAQHYSNLLHSVLASRLNVVWLQAYIKTGAGDKGFGPLSVGFIVDKTIDV